MKTSSAILRINFSKCFHRWRRLRREEGRGKAMVSRAICIEVAHFIYAAPGSFKNRRKWADENTSGD